MSQPLANRKQGYPELALVIAALVVTAGLLGLIALVGALHLIGRSHPSARWIVILGAAQVMADCSVVGIWWARSAWPSHAKTLLAVFCGAALWGLLELLLESALAPTAGGAGWAASLATQAVVAGLGTTVVEALTATKTPRRSRYSILFLFVWTTLVAVLLGAGRQIAHRLNWTAAAVLGWDYFLQLQVIAIANATTAVLIFAVLRLFLTWPARIVGSLLAALACAFLTPYVMDWSFANPGESFRDMFVLVAAESLFLLCTLVPIQFASDCAPFTGSKPAPGDERVGAEQKNAGTSFGPG